MIAIIAVGRLRPAYREACDEYLLRLRRYVPVDEHEVREASRAPTEAVQRREEAERLVARVPPGATVVALARSGEAWSSVELARRMERWRERSRPVAFAIGGSHGLDDEFVGSAVAVWSLGPLTLPHELARVVVVEQLYRGFSILRGEAYHKGR